MLVDRARRRGRVVRLKGGDPGVFARLAEEVEAVRAPGWASRSFPASARPWPPPPEPASRWPSAAAPPPSCSPPAPITRGALPALDWDLLARTEGTLVFYMAVDALESDHGDADRAGPRRAGSRR